MDETDDRRERRLSGGLALLFGGISVLAALDMALDLEEGSSLRHMLVEAVLFLVAMTGGVWMGVRFRALAGHARGLEVQAGNLRARLEASEREASAWRQEAGDLISGLSGAIDRQLERWGLSPAEKEVALLLLKGLSHKEVGEVRQVGEATVRQQARALYKKAGLSGRHDLAAFFLEDLLGPRPAVATTPPSRPGEGG